MGTGLLLNALVCLAITISTTAFAYMLYKNKEKWNKISQPSLKALIGFWLLVGIYFLLGSIRIILYSSGMADIDKYTYYLASIPFVLIPVPLAFYIIYIITGKRRISFGVSFIFTIFGVIYLLLLNKSGISGPDISFWGSVYSVNNDFAIITYISGLFIVPTSMILGLMLLIFFRKVSNSTRSKIIFSLFSISFVFDFILLSYIAQSGEMQMASRIFIFIGSVFGYLAQFQPDSIKPKPCFPRYEDGNDEFEQI